MSHTSTILIGLMLAGLCRTPAFSEQNDQTRPPEDRRRAAYEEFEKKHRDTLDKSPLYDGLRKSGLLDRAEAVDGPPPALRFTMKVKGKDADVMLTLEHGTPPQPEALSLLASGDKRMALELGEGRDMSSRLGSAVAAAREGGAATHGVSAEEVSPAGSDVSKKDYKDALASARLAAGNLGGARPLPTGVSTGARGADAAARRPESSSPQFIEWRNGQREWFRYEKQDGKLVKVPVARETPDGLRFLEGTPGHEAGVERYSRTFNGEKAFLRFENGVPQITHVDRDGQWVPLGEAKTREGFLKDQLIHTASDGSGGTARFAYRFDENGQGVRTHQMTRLGVRDYWAELEGGRPLAASGGMTRQLVAAGNKTALVGFAPDGSAGVTHIADGSTLRLASGFGKDLKDFSQVVHEVKSSDGKMDSLAYRFTRAEDGSFKGSVYAQQLRNSGSDTWVAVNGKPLDRPAGSQLQVLRSGQDKLVVRFTDGGAKAEVLAGGRGQLVDGNLSGVRAASFKAEAVFDGEGAKPGSAFKLTFGKGPDGKGYAGRLDEQWVDVGLGRGNWAKLSDGKPLAGEAKAESVRAVRQTQIAALGEEVRTGQAAAEKRLRDGMAWYNSNPAVASRVASVFESVKPGRITAQEVRAAASRGEAATVPELGGAKADVVHRIRAEGAPATPPARSLFLAAGSDQDAADQQGALATHKAIIQDWVKNGGSVWGLPERTLEALRMNPEAATVAMISGPELQSTLDSKVNPGIAAMPKVAAGIGISQNPGRAAEGAARLNPNVPARRGGGGGLFGRLLNIPGRANGQIYGQASANAGRAQKEMEQAKTEATALVAKGLEQKRLESIDKAERGFAKQGIGSVDIVDVGAAKPQAGFSYLRDDGGRYLLRLGVNESALPREAKSFTQTGTPGQRLLVNVDLSLNSQARAAGSKGLSQGAIDGTWDKAIMTQFGVDAAEAAAIRRRLQLP